MTHLTFNEIYNYNLKPLMQDVHDWLLLTSNQACPLKSTIIISQAPVHILMTFPPFPNWPSVKHGDRFLSPLPFAHHKGSISWLLRRCWLFTGVKVCAAVQ